jgi:hypothetical protein
VHLLQASIALIHSHLTLIQQQLDPATIADFLLDRRPAKGSIGKHYAAEKPG